MCGRVSEKNFKSKFHVFGWFPCLQNLKSFEIILKSFLGRNNSLKPPVFGFCDSHYGFTNCFEILHFTNIIPRGVSTC